MKKTYTKNGFLSYWSLAIGYEESYKSDTCKKSMYLLHDIYYINCITIDINGIVKDNYKAIYNLLDARKYYKSFI